MDNASQVKPVDELQAERMVYVLPEYSSGRTIHSEMSLRDLWNILWRGKWIVISVTALFALGSVGYALTATEWYRSEALLAPAEEKSTLPLGGQLGSLVALAGVSVGGGDSAEALAVLGSREFARAFIDEFDLLPVLFADKWDAPRGRWLGDDPEEWPEIRDAVKFFHDNVLKVSQDRKTNFVTLAIEWTDPDAATTWADAIVQRLNSRLRERALREAEANVSYLQSELAKTGVVTLQQSIGRLLESELQKLMLARGNEEFAFRVIDSPATPKRRVRPNRPVLAVAGTMLGGMLAVIGIFLAHAIRTKPESLRD
ncbi:MAG: Wzz/FepE/Etk N-terminal domain-containing protein [Gammaproteobacteria bacterium]